MYLYVNGEIVHESEAAISPFDHGYLYGLGVFETFRTYSGHPFLLTNHLARLKRGLKELNIEETIHEQKIREILNSLLEKNQLQDAYCRLNVSAGPEEIGLRTTPYKNETMIIFQKELPPLVPLREKEGVFLQLRRNTPETTERLKSHHYLNNIAAKRELGPSHDLEGIFLSKEDYICEGITSNIFWVKNRELYTPSVETGLLNGITRQFVLALAQNLKIPVHVGLFEKEKVLEADEIFFTNSVQEIMPVSKVESLYFPGQKGKYVGMFHHQYKKYVTHLLSIEELNEGESL
ncbi:aminodeoxychorismate lyase [Rossellomorea aquimaris]|uniref:aminodeoxychorismate lyase n=1 Tax=Rossellomorea aquimaris TaxID=189382 RepID=UPI0007D04919|nr:aminodeoxychorismate lyase [Rossellomorea aquimaris]